MDKLRKQRKPERTQVTRLITVLEHELRQDPINQKVVETSLKSLEDHLQKLSELDEKLKECLLDTTVSDEEYQKEVDSMEEYADKVRIIQWEINSKLYPSYKPPSPTRSSGSGVGSSNSHCKKTIKYPKIKLKMFSGALTEWLGWWAQFEKIDLDDELDNSDKFTYLSQSMTKGSRAEELVNSYPQSRQNYPKVIKRLKERFGNPRLLKQVYVRQLISMIISNRNGEKMNLSSLYDKLESYLRSLESLGVTSQQMVEFLYPMVESSLPEETLLAWQRSSNYGIDGSQMNPPRSEMDLLLTFLKKEIDNEEQRKLARSGFGTTDRKTRKKEYLPQEEEYPTSAGLFSGTSAKTSCLFCEKGHQSKDCFAAQRMTLDAKRDKVVKAKACFLCLKVGHGARQCKVKTQCLLCTKRHLVLFCPELPSHQSTIKDNKKDSEEETPTYQSNLNFTSEVILRTLMVKVENPITGKSRRLRALLDCGSQRSYLLLKTASLLGLAAVQHVTISHSLFGGSQVQNVDHNVYKIYLSDCSRSFGKVIQVMDQTRICGSVPRIKGGAWMNCLRNAGVNLNDTDKSDCLDIELLLGADILGDIITGRIHRLENGLTATETKLGWCIMGQVRSNSRENNLAMNVLSMSVASASITELWKLDTLGIRDPIEVKTQEERDRSAVEHFCQTVKKMEDGRYSVSLPWISESISIPNNKEVALKRLESTTRKLLQEGYIHQYEDIFLSWEREGIISKVKTEDEVESSRCHYLPHRAVLKLESKTTPIRPVFDASCKIGRAPSLNQCLERGPNFLEVIPSILLRFRMGKIGVTSDIRKAFLMISLNQMDQDSVRFLWWEDYQKKSLVTYRHNRVVFGMNCSPFLLGAVINFHLQSMKERYPEIVSKILNSLYVDNCVTSVDSVQEYENFKEVSTQLMADAKFELRQWERSNDGREQSVTNVLGLKWNKAQDTIGYSPLSSELPSIITKRVILSVLHQIYDPLGFLTPVLIIPKMLIQKAWAENKQWDEETTEEVSSKFRKWRNELVSLIDSFLIPRNCNGGRNQNEDEFQLHVFCDASKEAYAAAVFLRVDSPDGVSIQLLQSKSRVSPMKPVTIPRLELLSCCIAARLANTVKKALSIEFVPTYYWSDSSTALSWIKRSDEWGTFVGNRVREILKLSNSENWNHVPGLQNPADLPSRGISPSKFLQTKWWEGPSWLKMEKDEWPTRPIQANEKDVTQERKIGSASLIATSKEVPYYVMKNSYVGNLRLLALIYRFLDKSRGRSQETSSRPTIEELDSTELRLLKVVQTECFKNEGAIEGIQVERDAMGIVRVKTKLINRDDSTPFRFPILLPSVHPMVDLLIRDEHIFNCHGGIQYLMGKLREKFWIHRARKAIQKNIRSCITCQRFTSKKIEVPVGPLPEDRVKDAGAFEITGIDLAGPLILKNKSKVWIVLFTCGVYRGIHLELVNSMSTEDFLLAFTRFCLRKRRPAVVYTDNGTNFVGAVNLFQKIDWREVEVKTQQQRIKWRFNPPSAPWWGGWWERLIRSVKDLLKRVLGFGKLSRVKLETCLCEVEAVVNNRPLTYVTEDSEDLIPLTPAMFHYNFPSPLSIPEAESLKTGSMDQRKKSLDHIFQELQNRFRREYLAHLVHRGKQRSERHPNLGDVVLVGRDDKKRILWPMARIMELIPGKDGTPRVAKVKTKTGTFIRPFQRLYPLELSHHDSVIKDISKPPVPKSRSSSPRDSLIIPVRNIGEGVSQHGERTTRSGRPIRAPVKFCSY